MNFKLLLILIIVYSTNSFLFELEVPGKVKECVFEDFVEGENISVKAFLFDDQKK